MKYQTQKRFLWTALIGLLAACGLEKRKVDNGGGELTPSYSIFLASGFPTAGSAGVVSEWSSTGVFRRIVRDYASSGGYFPQSLDLITVGGTKKLLSLAFNTTVGRVDKMDLDGQNYVIHIDNAAALIAGTRRLSMMDSGALLVARTAGVEQFNSAGQRVGAAARFAANGACINTGILDSDSVEISGAPYVINITAVAGANNLRLQIYNGTTGVCAYSPLTQPGPGGTVLWPVALDYNPTLQKLFVLYYPFTGATTNAQIWSFSVTATTVTNPTLVYSDAPGDIAIISATPNTGSGDISVYSDTNESFILVGTTFNSVLRLNLDTSTGTATKVPGAPLIYNSVFSRNISSVLVVPAQ